MKDVKDVVSGFRYRILDQGIDKRCEEYCIRVQVKNT